jgi:rhodanese-related sulfurtransferase
MTTKFLIDNVLFIVLALVSGGMLLVPRLRGGGGGGGLEVSTALATQLINRENAVVIDVRDAEAFASGRVLNARHLPAAEIEARAGELARYKDRPIIVCCDSGNRARASAAALRKLGFARAMVLAGGLGGWRAAGLPVVR